MKLAGKRVFRTIDAIFAAGFGGEDVLLNVNAR